MVTSGREVDPTFMRHCGKNKLNLALSWGGQAAAARFLQ
jgi:hypothetical protein